MSFFSNVRMYGLDESGNISYAKVNSDGHQPVEQGVVVSTGNCSNSNISGNSWFSGIADDTLGVNSIQVVFSGDTNCLVYVDQSSNGTNWEISDEYEYLYAKGGHSWTTQAIAAYFRTRVYNNSSSATTTFRLQSILCPWAEPLPRRLSSEGNLKVGIYEIEGETGAKVQVTPMHQLRTSSHVKLVGSNFSNYFDANFWTIPQISGSAQYAVGSGLLLIRTGDTANSSIRVSSVRTGRYVGGNESYYRAVVRCPSGVIPSGILEKRWGAFDAGDGFYFESNNSGISVCCRKNGSDSNKVLAGNFNGVLGSTYTLNQNAHTYEIHWTNSKTWFYIDGELLHTFTGSATTLTNTLHLKISSEINCSNNLNADNVLEIRTATINRISSANSRPISKYINTNSSGLLKYGPGTLESICFASKGGNNNYFSLFDSTTTTTGVMFGPCDTSTIISNEISFGSQGLDFYSGLYYLLTGSTPSILTVIYE